MGENIFYFDTTNLCTIADTFRSRYQSEKPFPHIVTDGFVPEEILKKIAASIPRPGNVSEKNNVMTQKKARLLGGGYFF